MNIEKMVIFGMLLQSEVFEGDIGIDEKDEDMFCECLVKFFNLKTEVKNLSQEDAIEVESEIADIAKKLVIEYRKELLEYLK